MGGVSEQRVPMTRAARTARGALGATVATLLAATSHGLAGGAITPIAILATALVALPLCVALAGRIGSLWRLSLAVGASQLLYHWSFWSLGTPGGGIPLHAHGGVAPMGFVDATGMSGAVASTAGTGGADTGMWIAHAVAAVLTIALLHRGELAVTVLARLILRVLPLPRPRPITTTGPRVRPVRLPVRPLHERLVALSAISHRGPPQPLHALAH
ncbi:MAG: hypothetical protein KDB25_08125 [Leucobacter sp.]|nr:hypothetical protein [Leucobacter sp.]